MAAPTLDDRQKRFADLVLSGMTGTQAVVEARYDVPGDDGAAVCAAKLKQRTAVGNNSRPRA